MLKTEQFGSPCPQNFVNRLSFGHRHHVRLAEVRRRQRSSNKQVRRWDSTTTTKLSSTTTMLLLSLGSGTSSTSRTQSQPKIVFGRLLRHLHRLLPVLLPIAFFFLLAPTASSRGLPPQRPLQQGDELHCCKFTSKSNMSNAVVASVVVSSTDDATQLGEDLLCCPGAIFEVEWHGRVGINHCMEVVDGTSLNITVRSVDTHTLSR